MKYKVKGATREKTEWEHVVDLEKPKIFHDEMTTKLDIGIVLQ